MTCKISKNPCLKNNQFKKVTNLVNETKDPRAINTNRKT